MAAPGRCSARRSSGRRIRRSGRAIELFDDDDVAGHAIHALASYGPKGAPPAPHEGATEAQGHARAADRERVREAAGQEGARAGGGWGSMSLAKEGTAVAGTRRRRSSWAALLFAVAVWSLSIPTFGMSVLLAPIGLLLSAAAWRRASHDALFWVGLSLNAILVLSLVAMLIGLLTGDVAIGFE
jgi:hypothetical protein